MSTSFYKFCVLTLSAFISITATASDKLEYYELTVDGIAREALIYTPSNAKTELTPVIFAFHGHGGTMKNAAASFGYHIQWTEAIVIYMQGLNTPGKLTDTEGKNWDGNQV